LLMLLLPGITGLLWLLRLLLPWLLPRSNRLLRLLLLRLLKLLLLWLLSRSNGLLPGIAGLLRLLLLRLLKLLLPRLCAHSRAATGTDLCIVI